MPSSKSVQRSPTSKLLVLFLSIFCGAQLYADNATLDGDILFVPHIKTAGAVYSVTLRKSSDSLPSSFDFVELMETTYIEGSSGTLASYSSSRNELDIPAVVIDEKTYHMTLAGGPSANSYIIKSFGLNVPDFLFMVNAGDLSYAGSGAYGDEQFGKHFILSAASPTQIFSDRPFRIAHALNGSLDRFVELYANSDFSIDSPNTTFTGTDKSGDVVATVFELGQPVAIDNRVIFPVTRFIGSEPAVLDGDFTGSSFIVDNFWDTLEAIAAPITSGAAPIITSGAACAGSSALCAAAIVAAASLIGN